MKNFLIRIFLLFNPANFADKLQLRKAQTLKISSLFEKHKRNVFKIELNWLLI